MKSAMDAADKGNIPVEYRNLPNDLRREIFGQSLKSTLFPLSKDLSVMGLAAYGLYTLLKLRR